MAKSSLDDSACAGNPSYASRIAFTHLAQGYALVRIELGEHLIQCSPSLIHDYLWLLSYLLEMLQANLDLVWKARRLKGLSE